MDYGTSGVNRPKNQTMQQEKQAAAPAADAFEFEDRPEPSKIEFGDGEVFTGILTNIERVMIGEPRKPAVRYSFEELETSKACFMNGTYQIDSKIRRHDVGHVIQIRYEGTDPNVSRNGNPMKKFTVRVSKNTAPGWANDGSQITDADIPAEFLA